MMSEIAVKHLSYSYESNGEQYPALHDVDFTVEDGEFICIIGHSGCGKSTLLRLLQGLLKPAEGEIQINGTMVTGSGSDRAIVFQQYSLFPWMRVKQQVTFGIRHSWKRCTKQEAEQKAEDMLKAVGMEKYRNYFPSQLSGGMRQRVAIARALAMEPEILLLDEPFGALDAKRRSQLQELLLSLWEQEHDRKTIIFVTHDIDEAILLADRIVFMADGTVSGIFPVPFARPRKKAMLGTDQRCRDFKEQLMCMFGEEEAEDEENL